MRVWLYARLSNDDDPAQNSLQNQQGICRAFAEKKGWTIVGSSADDNISGMNFSRRGLDMLTAAVHAKQVDAVLVKDLSRLGRHRTQTALFIDYLRERQVRVISATEGVDTFCEEDDLMIGVRGLMNDYYAKDIGKKRYPAGSTLWGERPQHSSGPSGAAKKYDKRTKPMTGSFSGRMPA